jgi:hypothetical protein
VLVEDDECSGQPSASKITENVEETRKFIHEIYHWTIHNTGINYGS